MPFRRSTLEGWKWNDPPYSPFKPHRSEDWKKSGSFFPTSSIFCHSTMIQSIKQDDLNKITSFITTDSGWSMVFFMQIHIPATSLWLRRFGLPRWPRDLVGAIMPAFAPPFVNKKSNWPLAKKVLKQEESEDVTSLLPDQNDEVFAKNASLKKKSSTAIMAEN